MVNNRIKRFRLGVDTGGTFTDVVLVEEVTGEISQMIIKESIWVDHIILGAAKPVWQEDFHGMSPH